MRYLCFVPAGQRCSVGQKSPGRSYFSPRFDERAFFSGFLNLNTSKKLPVKIFCAYGGEEAAGTSGSGAEPHVLSKQCQLLGQLDIELNETSLEKNGKML